MKKLLVYMKEYWMESLLGPLFKLLEAGFELLVPLVIAAIIDTGIARADRAYIGRMFLLLVALGVVGMVSSITAQFFAAKAAVGFGKKLRRALFAHIQSLSHTELDTLGVSTLITRMTSDMNQVQTGMNLTLRLVLRSPFVVFGAMIMAFTIDARAALVFVAAIPVLAVIVFAVMFVCIPLYQKAQARLDRVLGLTRENLSGVRVIRAFAKEQEEQQAFEERTRALAHTQRAVGLLSALTNPLTYVVINLAVAALIWRGAVRVEAGIITQGAVVALYNYMSQILVELIKLANLIITVTKAVASGNRIAAMFDVQSSLDAPARAQMPADSAEAVSFHHVSLCYHGAAAGALTDIHFTAKKGETIGIIGGTGSGKSSLVNLIPRFYDATEGVVAVGGLDVKQQDVQALRARIGVVPQRAVLFRGTIRDNMRWGNADARDEEIMAALDAAQALDILREKQDGLDHMIEQGGKNLSGGQRQRLTIARALVKKPDILILDDSASALDLATDAALRRALRDMLQGVTVFIVSQRASAIRDADTILVLNDGRIEDQGTHAALLGRCAIYREIHDTQFEKGGDSVGD